MPVDAKPAVFWRDLELKQKVFVEITTEQGIRVERLVVQSIGPSAHPELLHIIFPFGISRFAPKNLLIDSPLTLRIAELCRAAAEQALFERKLGEMQQEAERIATVTVLQASAVDVGQVVRCLATRSGMRDPWLEVTEIARESISDDFPEEIVLTGVPDRFSGHNGRKIRRVYRPDELLELQAGDASPSSSSPGERAAQSA